MDSIIAYKQQYIKYMNEKKVLKGIKAQIHFDKFDKYRDRIISKFGLDQVRNSEKIY